MRSGRFCRALSQTGMRIRAGQEQSDAKRSLPGHSVDRTRIKCRGAAHAAAVDGSVRGLILEGPLLSSDSVVEVRWSVYRRLGVVSDGPCNDRDASTGE